MVKISKNAKKILALTLAGVMTVGTVVPGSALSTVENVQAETTQTVESVFADVQKAFENLYNTAPVVIPGDEDYTTELKNDLETSMDWTNKYSGFTLEVTPVTYFEGAKYAKTVKVTVSKDGESKSETWNVPKTYMTASDVAKTYLGANSKNEIDLSAVTVTAEMTNTAVEKAVEKYVADQLAPFSRAENYGVDANVQNATTTNNVKTFELNITLTNNLEGSDSLTVTGKTNVDVPSEDSDAKKAADLLANSFNSLTVDGLDINLGTDKLDEINQAIEKEAKIIVEDSFTTIKSITASKSEIIADGVWKGILTLTDLDGKTAEITLEIHLSNKEDEKKLPVKFELVKPVTEINVGDNIGDLADSMKVTFEDGSTESIEAADFDKNVYFTYDKAAFDTSKLGKITVEFFGKNSETQAKTELSVNVVSTVTYDNTKLTNDKITKDDIKSVISSDETVVLPVVDKDGKIQSLKALKAGKVTVTVIGKDGTTYNTEVTVDEKGTFTYGTPTLAKTDRYVLNTAAEVGFVANKLSVTQDPDSWRDDTVINAELTTVGNQKVVKITPVSKGTATITLKGGLKGQLTTTLKVTVGENNSVTIAKEKVQSYAEIKLTDNTIKKLQAQTFEVPTSEKKDIAVSSLGFDTKDEILLYGSDGKLIDSVYASDADSAQLVKEGSNLKLYISYAKNQVSPIDVTKPESKNKIIANTVDVLGLVADSVKSITCTDEEYKNYELVKVEFTEDKDGNSQVTFIPGKDVDKVGNFGTDVEVVLKDKLDNTAKVTVRIYSNAFDVSVSELFNGYKGYEVIAPTKTVYDLGEKTDLSGAYLKKDDKKIALTAEMVSEFNTIKATLDGEKLGYKDVIFNYGGLKDDKAFRIQVKPASKEVSVNSLGLSSDEKVVSVANRGDVSISSSLTSDKKNIEIVATEVSKSGAAIVTTNKGNTVAVKINVDENGTITTEVAETFVSSIAIVDNTEAVLGINGVSVESSDIDVVIASLAGNKVVLTSVNPGTAVVTVKDGDKTATINVTVDEFGTITTEVVKYQQYAPGWHAHKDGGWFYVDKDGNIVENGWIHDDIKNEDYYIEGGKTVYNSWKKMDGIWYYFNKWGVCAKDGWMRIDGRYYFFEDNKMQSEKWLKSDKGEWSYVDKSGKAVENGWAVIGGKYYHFNSWAVMSSDQWIKSDKGEWSYVDASGAAKQNTWAKIDGQWYYFNKWGVMETNKYIGNHYVNKWGVWVPSLDKK